jgi:predicted DsbA family dithiol-disulfide isomerase
VRVDIWSDVVCPWCYVGKRNFEQALAQFDHRDAIEVRWRSFELDPRAPRTREGAYADRLARKYGVGVDEAQSMIDRMTGAGAAAGLDLRFDLSRPGNTFDAHRLIHLAGDRGIQDAVKERLMAATFTEGAAIGEPDALARLAVEAGLDADDVDAVLGGDKYTDAVRADEHEATELGITAVPFFVIDGKYGVPGAQPPDVLLRVLDRMWAKSGAAAVDAGAADACDGDSCAV